MIRHQHILEGEEGFALIAVLGFLMLLAIFLTPFATSARLQALLVNNELQNLRLNSTAEAIDGYLIWRLSKDLAWRRLADRGEIDRAGCREKDTDYAVSIVAHGQLISLNSAESTLIESGLNSIGIDGMRAPRLASDIIAFRSPRGDDEENDRVQSGLKHAPFEDISELYDFNELQDVPMSSIIRTFSAWSGRSIPSALDDLDRPSQHYTIITRITTGAGTGQDAAVYALGGQGGLGTKVSSIVQDLDIGQPQHMLSCEDLLGPKAASVLRGAGL